MVTYHSQDGHTPWPMPNFAPFLSKIALFFVNNWPQVRLRRALRQGPVRALFRDPKDPYVEPAWVWACRVAKSGAVGFVPKEPKPNRPRA